MLRRDMAMVRAAQQRQAKKLDSLTRDEETLARDTHAMRNELLADLPAALPGAVAAKVAELINPLRADVDELPGARRSGLDADTCQGRPDVRLLFRRHDRHPCRWAAARTFGLVTSAASQGLSTPQRSQRDSSPAPGVTPSRLS